MLRRLAVAFGLAVTLGQSTEPIDAPATAMLVVGQGERVSSSADTSWAPVLRGAEGISVIDVQHPLAAGAGQGSTYMDVVLVNMPALLANPEKYDGRAIRVCGYFARDRESNALFLHKEDHDVGLIPNSVTVRGGESERATSGSYVMFEGRFNAPSRDRPHIDGGVLEVARAQPLPKPVN